MTFRKSIVKDIRFGRLAGLGLVVIGLTGCLSLDFDFPQRISSRGGAHYLEGAASGARYESFLDVMDRRGVEEAAWRAVNAEAARQKFDWSSSATGSFGSVQSGVVYLVNFNAGEEIEAPLALDTTPYLEPSAGNFITTSNTNVRLSPDLKGDRAMLLPQGTSVEAVAFEPRGRWYLVAHNGKVAGYIFADLLTKTEGGDLLLAGGERQQPRLCRELVYEMLFKTGKRDDWLNGACREGAGSWAVVGGRSLEEAMY